MLPKSVRREAKWIETRMGLDAASGACCAAVRWTPESRFGETTPIERIPSDQNCAEIDVVRAGRKDE
jgi:hypothetical protein